MKREGILKNYLPDLVLQLDLLIDHKAISKRIQEVASLLKQEYREITIVMIMKGSIFLVADLMRFIDIPVTLEFLQCRSYGLAGTKRQSLAVEGLDSLEIAGKDVLVIDDILDSGETLFQVTTALKAKKPKRVRSLVLMSKKVPRQVPITVDYVLFEIEDRFVVGYGLDYKEHYRNLPDIYAIVEDA